MKRQRRVASIRLKWQFLKYHDNIIIMIIIVGELYADY